MCVRSELLCDLIWHQCFKRCVCGCVGNMFFVSMNCSEWDVQDTCISLPQSLNPSISSSCKPI